jgi:hypothetical protein
MKIDPSSAKLLGMSPCTVIHWPSRRVIPFVLWVDTEERVYASGPLTVKGDHVYPEIHDYKTIRLDVSNKIIYIDCNSEDAGEESSGGIQIKENTT